MDNTEFRKNATAAISSAFMKAFCNTECLKTTLNAENTFSRINSYGSISFIVDVDDEGIKYSVYKDVFNPIKMLYYTYDKEDNHEEIIRDIADDFYKMVKNHSKSNRIIHDNIVGEYVEFNELKEKIDSMSIFNNGKEDVDIISNYILIIEEHEKLPLSLCEELKRYIEDIIV